MVGRLHRRGAPAAGAGGAFRAIWAVVARIPRGRVATYGQVARMAGLPGGARTAGWAMRAVPEGLRILGRPVPWQRVINAAGGISLPRGSGETGDRQVRILRREGVILDAAGRVDLAVYRWDGAAGPSPDRRTRRSGGRRLRPGVGRPIDS